MKFECRLKSGYKLAWVKTSGVNDAPLEAFGNTNVNTCKLKDQRPIFGGGGSTGFPLQHNRIQISGIIDVAIIPIDFVDSKAPGKPAEYILEHLQMLDARNKYLYGDRIVYRWHLIENWLTLPKESKYFVFDKRTVQPDGSRASDGQVQILSDDEQAGYVFSAAEKYVNIKEMDFFWVFSNPYEQNVQSGPYGSGRTVKTPANTYENLNYYPLGFMMYNGGWLTGGNGPIFDTMAHEMAHAHGLVQHAPGNGWGWYISNNPTWESWLAGWRPDSEFVCIDGSSSFSKANVSLSSMDLDSRGFKSLVVKVSNTQAIVVESRRKGPFSSSFEKGFAGITAYVVEMTKAGDRWDSNLEKEKDYYAYFLRNQLNTYPKDEGFGTILGDKNIIALEGDFFAFNGIKITLAKSGDFDEVLVERL